MIYELIGRRLRGKSTLALFLAERTPQYVIFDPRGLFACDVRLRDRTSIDLAISEFAAGKRDTIVITPIDDVNGVFAFTCECLRDVVIDQPQRSFTFLVDEVRFISLTKAGAFDFLLRCSDPQKVDIVLTCHGWIDIHPDIRRIADHFLLFHSTEELDLKAIEERCGKKARAMVETLGQFEFVQWDDGAGVLHECRDSGAWFRPLAHAKQPGESADRLDGLVRKIAPLDKDRLF